MKLLNYLAYSVEPWKFLHQAATAKPQHRFESFIWQILLPRGFICFLFLRCLFEQSRVLLTSQPHRKWEFCLSESYSKEKLKIQQ